MSTKLHIQFATVLLVVSIVIEITLLAKLFENNNFIYHGLHVMFMSLLAISQLVLYMRTPKQLASRKYALWFALGMISTMIGDFVNGALSNVNPVSLKLTWAMLLFGIGYTLYNISIWHHNKHFKGKQTPKTLYFILMTGILIINVLSWLMHVEKNINGIDLLYYGSFIFNATIYVFMPLLAIQFFLYTNKRTSGLVVLIGAMLIPYSDLILFASWLRGNPAEPSFELYAYNWILYFSGQALITMFPAFAIEEESVAKPHVT